MKSTKLLPVIVVLASLLLSACSGLGSSLAAPAAVITTGQSVSAPLVSAPVAGNSQAAADVASIQSAYEAVYQSVNPSVVTIMISSQVSGQGNGQNSQGQVVPTAQGSGFIWDAPSRSRKRWRSCGYGTVGYRSIGSGVTDAKG